MQITESVIAVTGASGGIGVALCHALAEEGARLILVGRHAEPLQRLAGELAGQHLVCQADLSAAEDRSRLVSYCIREQVNGLVNVAGVMDFREYADQTPEMIERMMTVNLLAPMLLCRALLPHFRKQSAAFILNTGSVLGSIGHPGFVSYGSSKAGLSAFTEALARELSGTPVKVFLTQPRATRTDLNDDRVNAMNRELGNRADSPERVAEIIVQQIRKEKTRVIIGWPEKLFVLLNGCLPAVVGASLVKKLDVIRKFARQ